MLDALGNAPLKTYMCYMLVALQDDVFQESWNEKVVSDEAIEEWSLWRAIANSWMFAEEMALQVACEGMQPGREVRYTFEYQWPGKKEAKFGVSGPSKYEVGSGIGYRFGE